MPLYTNESIETLRQRIDLVDVLMSHLDLKRSGASYKALCPFHEEKSPSFMVQKGDSHYHCFGCGAHGDAIAFFMGHLKMGFVESVESLAERFGVALEKTADAQEEKGPSKTVLKNALEHASQLCHYLLLHSVEGHEALQYLYKRGINLDFISRFELGYAPKSGDVIFKYLRSQGVDEAIIEQVGLLNAKKRDFFTQRILFPIRDGMGAVIGFSGRKFREETFGGKYINTPETPLFKKSRVLFGLSYSRARIAKERKAIIVEGQIDALRLIYSGFDYTVAGQGTAFGQDHAKELMHLGVATVFLALDGDEAGREAAAKIGNLFLHKGVDVRIVPVPKGKDPDALLLERGPIAFQHLLEESSEYLTFLYHHLSHGEIELTPSRKNEIVKQMADTIKSWEEPVMVHESLKKLSQIAQVPETALGLDQIEVPDLFIRKSAKVEFDQVNPDRILETDFLRWLFVAGAERPQIIAVSRINVRKEHFRIEAAYRLYEGFMKAHEEKRASDLLTIGASLEKEDEQRLLSEIMQRKINIQKAQEGCEETIRKILIRSWMQEREAIRIKLHSTYLTDDEALELAKQFDALKSQIPELVLP
jgi:DNA primase